MFDEAEKKNAIVKVGEGRGFIIEHRCEIPPFEGERCFLDCRLVVTAAHCLPRMPPRAAASFWHERTYSNLLGTLNGKPEVWAECLFVDPVADIAVLGEPDDQDIGGALELPDHGTPNDLYHELTDEPAPLRIGKIVQKGWEWQGWARLLALDGEWARVKVGLKGRALWIEGTSKNEGGMSGSPIFADDGTAIGVLVMGTQSRTKEGVLLYEKAGPQPVLAQSLPGWLLRELD